MNYKVIYLPVAEQDIDEIGAYMSQFYPSTFKNFLRKLQSSIRSLQTTPCLGTPFRNYRRLVASDYLVFYKVDEEQKTVRIYRVLHCSRDLEVQNYTKE